MPLHSLWQNSTQARKIKRKYYNIFIFLSQAYFYIFFTRILNLQIFSCVCALFFSTIILIKGGEIVQDRVEPPVLMSRLLTFVFAAALVVLVAMAITVYNMFPLNRPQVFFLTTAVRDDLEVTLREMPAQDEFLDNYKKLFIREYMRARNEVSANSNVMSKKWNGDNGVVRTWSNDDVYADFTQTDIWNEVMSDTPDYDQTCLVEFETGAINYLVADDAYQVKFRYICTNSSGLESQKDYIIKLRLSSEEAPQIKWSDRLETPLGLRVTEYSVMSGDGTDPLDTGFVMTE